MRSISATTLSMAAWAALEFITMITTARPPGAVAAAVEPGSV
jgi:hypothetical protein